MVSGGSWAREESVRAHSLHYDGTKSFIWDDCTPLGVQQWDWQYNTRDSTRFGTGIGDELNDGTRKMTDKTLRPQKGVLWGR